jgi:hypothetical protein
MPIATTKPNTTGTSTQAPLSTRQIYRRISGPGAVNVVMPQILSV